MLNLPRILQRCNLSACSSSPPSSLAPLQALECLLSVYVKNNFVGPPSDLPLDLSQLNNLAFERLSVDGETPFPLVRNIFLLWFCKEFSRHMIASSKIMVYYFVALLVRLSLMLRTI